MIDDDFRRFLQIFHQYIGINVCRHPFVQGMQDIDLTNVIKKNFDLRPGCITRDLNLKRPIFKKTAAYGHFGRNDPDFTWEQVKTLEL